MFLIESSVHQTSGGSWDHQKILCSVSETISRQILRHSHLPILGQATWFDWFTSCWLLWILLRDHFSCQLSSFLSSQFKRPASAVVDWISFKFVFPFLCLIPMNPNHLHKCISMYTLYIMQRLTLVKSLQKECKSEVLCIYWVMWHTCKILFNSVLQFKVCIKF